MMDYLSSEAFLADMERANAAPAASSFSWLYGQPEAAPPAAAALPPSPTAALAQKQGVDRVDSGTLWRASPTRENPVPPAPPGAATTPADATGDDEATPATTTTSPVVSDDEPPLSAEEEPLATDGAGGGGMSGRGKLFA